MTLRLDTLATEIDVAGQRLSVRGPDGTESTIVYDELMVGTGALPSNAGITGLDRLGPDDGVHVLHSMGDTFALERYLDERQPARPSSSARDTSDWRWPRPSPCGAWR